MNYLLVCCVLILLPLNLGWETYYVIKMLGWVFAFLSVKEIYEIICIKAQKKGLEKPDENFTRIFENNKKFLFVCGGIILICMTIKGISVGLQLSDSADNILSGICGSICTVIGVIVFRKLLDFGQLFGRNVVFSDSEDFSPLFYKAEKSKRTFTKFMVFCAVNLVCDILNRFVNVKCIQTYAGVAGAISKIVLYIILIILTVSVNKMRKEADSEIS